MAIGEETQPTPDAKTLSQHSQEHNGQFNRQEQTRNKSVKRGEKRQEGQQRYGEIDLVHEHVLLCVPITPVFGSFPKGSYYSSCWREHKGRASRYLGPSSSPGEHSRHSKSICLSAPAPIQTRTNQISFFFWEREGERERHTTAGPSAVVTSPSALIASLPFQRGHFGFCRRIKASGRQWRLKMTFNHVMIW